MVKIVSFQSVILVILNYKQSNTASTPEHP